MIKYIQLIRVKHWIKNFLIFLPLIFSHSFDKIDFINIILGFLSFSFISSFVYIINDIKDLNNDKKHPKKKFRPLASNKISITSAIKISIILLIISLVVNYFITRSFFDKASLVLVGYLIINILYSFGMKNMQILDVVLLATGFILRVYYGAFIIDVPVSNWLFLTILNVSLYLGLGKRKKELLIKDDVRKVLKHYDETFLDKFMNICLTLVIVFYSLWVIEQEIKFLFLSIPIVMIIFMQYMLYMDKSDEGDPITILFENKTIILTCCTYVIFMIITMFVI